MELLDIVKYSEEDVLIDDKDWFYHAFSFENENISDMLIDGIKAPILINRKKCNGGNNGWFYVSVAKRLNTRPDYHYAYSMYSTHPMFIIDGIHPVKCDKNILSFYSQYTPLPFRDSEYVDEYQQFLKISADKIRGIQYKLYASVGYNNVEVLKQFRKLALLLDELNLKLPIYDYSFERIGIIKKVNPEIIIELTKKLKD